MHERTTKKFRDFGSNQDQEGYLTHKSVDLSSSAPRASPALLRSSDLEFIAYIKASIRKVLLI